MVGVILFCQLCLRGNEVESANCCLAVRLGAVFASKPTRPRPWMLCYLRLTLWNKRVHRSSFSNIFCIFLKAKSKISFTLRVCVYSSTSCWCIYRSTRLQRTGPACKVPLVTVVRGSQVRQVPNQGPKSRHLDPVCLALEQYKECADSQVVPRDETVTFVPSPNYSFPEITKILGLRKNHLNTVLTYLNIHLA